jgi:hypothetical protein
VKRFVLQAGRAAKVDLEALEFGLRGVVLAAGARALEALVAGVGSGRRGEAAVCCCGTRMQSRGREPKRIRTILGEIEFRRSRYVCPACGASRFPGDEALDVAGTGFSPGLRRLMARAGSRDTFKQGREDLREYAGVEVDAKDVERVAEQTGKEIAAWEERERAKVVKAFPSLKPPAEIPLLYASYDGTGVPMVPWEVAGRKGKQADGSAKTREAKLGCVFTQTGVDEKGWPVRDEAGTSFVGAIEGCERFGERMHGEAVRRGLARAEKVVVIGDGAKWIWELAALHFPGAVEIVDLYHARQHLHQVCGLVNLRAGETVAKLEIRWRTALDEGKVEKILAEAEARLARSGARRKAAKTELGYFRTNAARMGYAKFRDQDLFVGSGVVEAGCKTVIGKRLKQSGMEWTVLGANAILALRCCQVSGRIEEFWEQRTG